MDTQTIRAQMPTLVVGHVPSNVRSFKFNIFDGQPKVSTLGFHIDPKPFEGKVIATTDEAIVVKTGRAEFAVLDRTLVTEVPDEGVKVQVEPYVRRRFDGQRADTPEEHTEFTGDGQPYTVKRFVLGSAPAKLPIPESRCPELQELVDAGWLPRWRPGARCLSRSLPRGRQGAGQGAGVQAGDGSEASQLASGAFTA